MSIIIGYADTLVDPLYDVFARPDFDANEYANAILAGEPFPPPPTSSKDQPGKLTKTSSLTSEPAKEDISVAISKLTVGIDDVSKQLKSVVCAPVLHIP